LTLGHIRLKQMIALTYTAEHITAPGETVAIHNFFMVFPSMLHTQGREFKALRLSPRGSTLNITRKDS